MEITLNVTHASLQDMKVTFDTIGNISNDVVQLKALFD